ncbi:MAG TPA: M48 family metalloprotease [Myxococcota bacterium]|nr:M48 family metalloprotease [Myxococcota bacterium]
MTTYDDARVGRESKKDVEAEVGVIDDPKLQAYVDGIGHKLLRGMDRRGFDYEFAVVDMLEPNAFALPGGYVFISRGLLALANNEDELACVIGHEITHAARRHAAAQQALMARQPPLAMPGMREKQLAGYSREMEREADEGGQILCAAAGYDPMGMSTFLTSLAMSTRLTYGGTPGQTFFATHPGSDERAAANAVRAREIRWKRDPALGDPRAALLAHLDGLEVGQRPEAGIFEGDRFIHPVLGFSVRFPPGWKLQNTNQAVGAMEPSGKAIVFLAGDAPAGNAEQVALGWVEQESEKTRISVEDSKPVKIGAIDAWRVDASAAGAGGSVRALLTFIPFDRSTWRIMGVSPSVFARRYEGAMLATARSFRPLTAEEREVPVTRLRFAKARAGETIAAFSERTGNTWTVNETAIYNGIFVDHRFEGGELVKFSRNETYQPGGGG